MYRINTLYPQYQYSKDRRQQNIPVAFERRSGVERRTEDRVQLDTKLTRDIFEVKGKIKDITGTISFDSSQNNIKNIADSNALNSVQGDEFVKTKNVEDLNLTENNAPKNSVKALETGLLAIALAGVLFTPFIGPAGAVIALGATLYVGAKVLKTAVGQQAKNSDKK